MHVCVLRSWKRLIVWVCVGVCVLHMYTNRTEAEACAMHIG